MSRVVEGIENGIHITDENSSDGVYVIQGNGLPGGDAGLQDEAPEGSLYVDRTGKEIYIKKASTNAASDWKKNGDVSIDELVWRNEKVRFATNDSIAAGTFDITTLTDNESMVIGDVVVGEYCLGDVDGTPALFEITAKPGGDNITIAAASQPLVDNDTYIVQQYLPDTPGDQEKQAIIHFPLATGPAVKLADINWSLADGITLNGIDDTKNGPVLGTDTVQVAIDKLEGDSKDSHQALGLSRGDTDMGTYTGNIISDNVSQKVVNQELETAIENISTKKSGTVAQATPTVVDTLLVDDFQIATWVITVRDTANPARVKRQEINAIHDGHGAADATTCKESVTEKINIGTVNLQVNCVLSGVGAAQTFGLEVNTTEAGGIQYSIERLNALSLAG